METRILINGRFLRMRMTGVQRYAYEVIRCLPGEVHMVIPPRKLILFKGPLWEQVILPGYLNKNDLLWSPANTGPLIVSNQVVTIHDVSTIDHPEWFNTRFSTWYRLILPQLSSRVRRIITDSQFSKNRIISLFKIPSKKVVVVPPGVGSNFKPVSQELVSQTLAKYHLPDSFILFVGSLEPRKNLARLFQAWELVIRQFPKLILAVVGAKGYPFRDPGLVNIPDNVRFLGCAEDADLPALYTGAIALIYPSLYEGFGLPVLEAMACGTPVITSNVTSLPEVAGEAALLVDPTDIEAMAQAVLRVLSDENLRHELRMRGLERARLFSWEKTAQQVWDVLHQTWEEINR